MLRQEVGTVGGSSKHVSKRGLMDKCGHIFTKQEILSNRPAPFLKIKILIEKETDDV